MTLSLLDENSVGIGSQLPQCGHVRFRRFLGLSDDDKANIADLIRSYLLQA
ncbi:MAG: hypothetical protein QM772_09880 [Ottowia sp.]|uniref:hypothetical protein n=1 Tax=Ottowia sp. TaxID=1898956 RepID=UPI0039E6FC60